MSRALIVAAAGLVVLAAVGAAIVLTVDEPVEPGPNGKRPPVAPANGGNAATDEAPDPARADPDDDGTLPERAAEGEPLFRPDGTEVALDAVDWTALAEALATIVRIGRDQAAAVNAGNPLPEGLDREWTAAKEVVPPEMAKLGDSVASVHPAGRLLIPLIYANAVDATLTHMGAPLTARQAERISALLGEHQPADDTRLAEDDRKGFLVRRIRIEAAGRQAFCDALYAVLTPQQHDLLRPRVLRDRLGLDWFSTTEYWAPMVRSQPTMVEMEAREDTGCALGDYIQSLYLARAFETPEEGGEFLQAKIPELFDDAPEIRRVRLDSHGHYRRSVVLEAVERTEKLLDLLAAEYPENKALQNGMRLGFHVLFTHQP